MTTASHLGIRKEVARKAWDLASEKPLCDLLKEHVSKTGLRNLLGAAGEAVVLEELLLVLRYQAGRGQLPSNLATILESHLNDVRKLGAIAGLEKGDERDQLELIAAREVLVNLVRIQAAL